MRHQTYKHCLLTVCSLISLLISSFAQPARQEDRPTDYLSTAFHKERRTALRNLMPPNSAAIFFANPVRNRSNDVDYVYHQDPDFYYLTGYKEPHAVLIIFSDVQQDDAGNSFDEMIFVQPKNKMAEMWTGRRLGVSGVNEQLGFDWVANNGQFHQAEIDFPSLDRVFLFRFREDVRDGQATGDLYDLMEATKGKVRYQEGQDPYRYKLYEMIKSTDIENSASVAKTIGRYLKRNPAHSADDPLLRFQQAENDAERNRIAQELPSSNLDFAGLDQMMNQLREIKTQEEVRLIRKAVDVSAVGQIEVMKAMHPKMSETEVQGIHEFVFKKYGAEYEGYPSIVGAGENGCILHYIDNLKPRLSDELVLMDLGAEYHGYTADVTRTIPADGTFSPEQKAIYDLVYEAQEAAIQECQPGNSFQSPHRVAQKVINQGLANLGIIKKGAFHGYFPHGTSHYLGLDVHDRGTYGPLEANMIITVEPGIYIPTNSNCDEKWWGIAVRIEDDVLITQKGNEVLSARAPRTSEDIEAMMAQPSPLDNFILPKLD